MVSIRRPPAGSVDPPRPAVWAGSRVGWSEGETRALHYFQEVAAQELSDMCDAPFWTVAVLQVSLSNAAVRHAVAAISSLHEQFHDPAFWASDPEAMDGNAFATRQYNAAIRHLVDGGEQVDDAVTLLACVLFVCLEFLQHHKRAAIEHCRHGVLILNNMRHITPWVRRNLLPIVRRISIFPYFFGASEATMPVLDDSLAHSAPPLFGSLDDAQEISESIAIRAMPLIRRADGYRLGRHRGEPIPDAMVQERDLLLAAMDRWAQSFAIFRALPRGAALAQNPGQADRAAMIEMHATVMRIWLSAQFDTAAGEMAFDRHLDGFQRIIDLARAMIARDDGQWRASMWAGGTMPSPNGRVGWRATDSERPKFTFALGMMPPLYFTVRWCRDLAVRLEALTSMRLLARDREGLFDAGTLASVGRSVISREHGIDLLALPLHGDLGQILERIREPVAEMNPHAWASPDKSVPTERRIWDAMITPETASFPGKDRHGRETTLQARRVRYIQLVDGQVLSEDVMERICTAKPARPGALPDLSHKGANGDCARAEPDASEPVGVNI